MKSDQVYFFCPGSTDHALECHAIHLMSWSAMETWKEIQGNQYHFVSLSDIGHSCGITNAVSMVNLGLKIDFM